MSSIASIEWIRRGLVRVGTSGWDFPSPSVLQSCMRRSYRSAVTWVEGPSSPNPDIEFVVEDVVAEGNRVAARIRAT